MTLLEWFYELFCRAPGPTSYTLAQDAALTGALSNDTKICGTGAYNAITVSVLAKDTVSAGADTYDAITPGADTPSFLPWLVEAAGS